MLTNNLLCSTKVGLIGNEYAPVCQYGFLKRIS